MLSVGRLVLHTVAAYNGLGYCVKMIDLDITLSLDALAAGYALTQE
jgi:hypothetical protein